MIIFDKLENMCNYAEYKKAWEFLQKNQSVILANGKYIIDEDCYVAVSEYDTLVAEGLFEGHLKNIDVHVIIEGEEYIQVQDKEKCALKLSYDEIQDSAFYSASSWHNFYLSNGYFIVLEQGDLHRPGIAVNGAKKAKKYVFKFRTDKR